MDGLVLWTNKNSRNHEENHLSISGIKQANKRVDYNQVNKAIFSDIDYLQSTFNSLKFVQIFYKEKHLCMINTDGQDIEIYIKEKDYCLMWH